jgi:hypothetical protein
MTNSYIPEEKTVVPSPKTEMYSKALPDQAKAKKATSKK